MNFKIESKFKAEVLFESSIAIGDWSYLVIYGKHINGYFCCLPGWHWGCEMAKPEEVAYNKDKLIECGASVKVATAIAEAIKTLANGSINKL